ncbi:hypothetical protein [Paenarthrobacter sp.]|uniref:hypothetical protein n=1 Tax=Paenarthrobacter sp. TaxID=1931993 RepID=UPI0028116B95|nr:hypothetical protein [Paenarthrobacter sp.]
MEYNGSPTEKSIPAGELDRRHVGHSVSFQPNDFTVVFGTIAGIARTEALVYLSLDGVAGGTHLKEEYDLPIDKNVYLQLDPLGSAEKGLSEAATFFKDKLDEVTKNLRDRDQGKSE